MKTYTVAILGATGAVGQEMMKILAERDFPVGKLVPLASARSAGKKLIFKGEEVTIQEVCAEAFQGVDIVLGAAENDIAEKWAPAIVAAGAVFVDNSSAFRLNPDVPLIVPRSMLRTSRTTRASSPIPTAPPSSPAPRSMR